MLVAQTEASELPEPTEESPEESEDTTAEVTEPSEEEAPDPLQELTERLGKVETQQSALSGLDPSRINPALGRISGLQSALDELKGQDPLSTLDPRFAANEALTAAVAEALINADSELVNDQSKAALRSTLTQVSETRSQRDREALKAELRSEIQTATDSATPQADTGAQAIVAQMTNQLSGYATGKGVEYSAIDPTVLQFQANETIEAAFDRVKTHIDGMANDEGAVDRLTERQGAASTTPSRSGAQTDRITTLLAKLEEEGQGALSEDEQQSVASHLGVKLHP